MPTWSFGFLWKFPSGGVGLNVQAERKRLNCVLRVVEMRRVESFERGIFNRSIWLCLCTAICFFTESLILAQNERWRRV